MKSIEQIVGYIEGRLSVLKHRDPPSAEAYELELILNYIKSDNNERHV